jgi:type I site-specific restriction endonuclease
MAKDFSSRGIQSVAVYSGDQGEYAEERSTAIRKLSDGDIRVIFSVDMFNEGVDITSLDMVMFLRPTESSVVFLQQLGRGLRTYRGKRYLNVLDFIGNYEKAGRVRFYLTGQPFATGRASYKPESEEYPDDCLVDFDMRLIDLFEQMEKKHRRLQEMVREEFYRVRDMLGHRPTRLELFTYMDADIYQMAVERANVNPFRKYFVYLHDLNELKAEETELYQSIGREFIQLIETTNMTKVYKMPVLLAFYNDGHMRMEVTEEQLLASWKRFFGNGTNWKDLDRNITYEEYKSISDKDHIRKIIQMPVHFLQESGKGFFVQKKGYALALREELRSHITDPAFVEQVKDVIEYRVMDYYQRRYHEHND